MESKHVSFQEPQANTPCPTNPTYDEEQANKIEAIANATLGKLQLSEGVKAVQYDQYGFPQDGYDYSKCFTVRRLLERRNTPH
jgi:hypothetical protein